MALNCDDLDNISGEYALEEKQHFYDIQRIVVQPRLHSP